MKITLETDIGQLPRIGKILAKRFAKLGLKNIYDLLFYYPFRYEDFSQIVPIAKIQPNTHCTILAKINLIANKRSFRRKVYLTECLVSDKTGSIKVVWFNQPFITKILKPGDTVYFSGKAEYSAYGLQLVSPTYEQAKKEQTHTARIVPMYSLTANLTEKQIRYLIKMVLPLSKELEDWLPPELLKKHELMPLNQAIKEVHFPSNKASLVAARRRLKFNEFFLIQMKTESIRRKLSLARAPAAPFNEAETKKFVKALPFRLTDSQRKSAWEILKDVSKTRPMNRLLEGDVGSGKTVVAAMAMLNVNNSGYQAVLMAPTEILAFQHYKTISRLFSGTKIKIALLTREIKQFDQRTTTPKKITEHISSGRAQIVVGTHALIQGKINFKKLGLVVIDEQHRFGVDQRKALKQKNHELRTASYTPHLLSMTATPIPRSLALTLYGDLDLSVITEMPLGRKKIITRVVPPEQRQPAYDFIRDEINHMRQVFVICPLIEESDKLGVKAATAEYERLKKHIFPDLKIGLLHGKMKGADKEKVMNLFAGNEISILVSTAVVEVGVDIPNASVMMIEGAERFGLAQLHQFRGRVGRAEHQSYCLVFTDSDSAKTQDRLNALVTAKNGFELAEKDLEFRGPGEIYGLRQSGFPDLKIAKLTDYDIIKQTKESAHELVTLDPQLNSHPLLKNQIKTFEKSIHLE